MSSEFLSAGLRKYSDDGCGTSVSRTTSADATRSLTQCATVRLENEHLGNVEQYRVTREVPLPYSFADG